jgi:hypothetical protein
MYLSLTQTEIPKPQIRDVDSSCLGSENGTIINFAGFKTFNTDFRKEFLSLEILDSKAVAFKADPEGVVGVVGFAQTFLFEKKSDGQLSTGDTVYVLSQMIDCSYPYKRLMNVYREIFEVAFVPEKENAPGRNRMITKAFAAFGDMMPISSSHTVARTSKTKGRVENKSGSVHSIATHKTRAAAPRGITKKRSATKNRK